MYTVAVIIFIVFAVALISFLFWRAYQLEVLYFKLAAAQSLAAICAIAIWFYFRTEQYLAGPIDGDTYAQTWGFQLMVFVVVYLPATLLAIVLVLLLEYVVFKGRK